MEEGVVRLHVEQPRLGAGQLRHLAFRVLGLSAARETIRQILVRNQALIAELGHDADGTRALREGGYHPEAYLKSCEPLARALEMIEQGYFSPDDRRRHHDVVSYLRHLDPYLICADFADYLACQDRAARAYTDRALWMRMVVKNIAHSGKFSSDRSIAEYAADIWNVTPLPVEVPPYEPPA
jgi:glucan phosphorylase